MDQGFGPLDPDEMSFWAGRADYAIVRDRSAAMNGESEYWKPDAVQMDEMRWVAADAHVAALDMDEGTRARCRDAFKAGFTLAWREQAPSWDGIVRCAYCGDPYHGGQESVVATDDDEGRWCSQSVCARARCMSCGSVNIYGNVEWITCLDCGESTDTPMNARNGEPLSPVYQHEADDRVGA